MLVRHTSMVRVLFQLAVCVHVFLLRLASLLPCFLASLLPCFLASLLPCFLASLLPCFLYCCLASAWGPKLGSSVSSVLFWNSSFCPDLLCVCLLEFCVKTFGSIVCLPFGL